MLLLTFANLYILQGNIGLIDTYAVIDPMQHLIPQKVEEAAPAAIGGEGEQSTNVEKMDQSDQTLQVEGEKNETDQSETTEHNGNDKSESQVENETVESETSAESVQNTVVTEKTVD